MEHNNGVSNITGHALPPLSPPSFRAATTHPFLSPNQIRQQMHHQVEEEEEEEEEEEKRKKMKLKSSANWLGLADNTYHHFSAKDITPSFPNTTTMDHPFLQLHPYHHHQQLPEMAIAKSSLSWQLGSNIRGEDNQSRINLTQDGSESLINLVSTVDGGGGGAQKWYNNSPEEEWERRVGFKNNPHMWDPTGFHSCNNIQQSFMNYIGNSSNTNNNTAVRKGGGSISSSSNSKDRHSKVFTAKGVRDRRIRLAVSTATQFYDIQDRLGFEQPSKAVDWLMSKARASIEQLPRMEPYSTPLSRHSAASIDLPISTATIQPNSDASHQYGSSTTDQIQDISGKSHAEEEEEEDQVIKVVPGVETRLADETSPLPLISIRRIIDIAATSFSYSSLQARDDSLRLCRSDRH